MILSNTQKFKALTNSYKITDCYTKKNMFKALTESNNSAIIRQQKQIQSYQEQPTNST